MEPVLFFGKHRPYFQFSNWHPAMFNLDGLFWENTEQAYMYEKSLDAEYRQKIRATGDPAEIKRLGRACTLRPKWDTMKYDVMVRVNEPKYRQNPDLAALLLGTGDRPIHEDCKDPWWGGGPNFPSGRDMLGKVLIDVRTRLRA